MAQLPDNDAVLTIEAVKKRFATERKAFGWVVGPLSRPLDLGPITTLTNLSQTSLRKMVVIWIIFALVLVAIFLATR